jgi:hypothetical protein
MDIAGKMTDLTCIVMTVRTSRERIVLTTSDGIITITLKPMSSKTGVNIKAPRAVNIRREPKEQSIAAVA